MKKRTVMYFRKQNVQQKVAFVKQKKKTLIMFSSARRCIIINFTQSKTLDLEYVLHYNGVFSKKPLKVNAVNLGQK